MECCIDTYNNILTEINKNKKINKFDFFMNLDNDSKYNCIMNFYKLLNNNDLFSLFSKMKIKVFSSKTIETHVISTSLFSSELSLKFIFNNMTDNIKNVYWEKLFRLYIDVAKNDTTQTDATQFLPSDRITVLIESIKNITNITNSNAFMNAANSTALTDSVKNTLFNVNVNNTTNNMIDDIVGSFQNIMKNKSNPFDNIMNITTMISDKYKHQLQSGDIQLDKIIGGIDGIIPGLMKQGGVGGVGGEEKKTVIIDENFSTSNVDIGKEEESSNPLNPMNMMKMIPNISGLVNMVNRINTAESDDDLSSIKKDMDNYLEKELKVDMTQFNGILNGVEKKFEDFKHDTTVCKD